MLRLFAVFSFVSALLLTHVSIIKGQEPINPESAPSKAVPKIIEGFVFIEGGCFEMGDVFGDGDSTSKPPHSVCVKDFYLAKEHITLGEFRQFVDETHYQTEAEVPFGDKKEPIGCVGWNGKEWKVDKNTIWRRPGFKQGDDHPVVCVSWNDAIKFGNWKSQKTGVRFRLPTEAEWEFAARSRGKKIKFSWGNGSPQGNIGDLAFNKKIPTDPAIKNYNDGYPFTSPVRKFKPNELGLFDMSGNAWQWVLDWYDPEYYKNSPKENPQGPEKGELKVLRGGSWGNGDPANFKTTYRGHFWPDTRSSFMGFRLAASPPSPN
ncbi:MAG: formylglycine-generating enzyme family protein [Nitrospirae bacterium]|nr:formylglycine-generating enzyme family protein [Nitrospirota bacterium]MBI3595053.1 formylglycine-generating enzyme family protein [Nitrospirota bacterium]